MPYGKRSRFVSRRRRPGPFYRDADFGQKGSEATGLAVLREQSVRTGRAPDDHPVVEDVRRHQPHRVSRGVGAYNDEGQVSGRTL